MAASSASGIDLETALADIDTILERLVHEYGAPERLESRPPIDELISTILSQSTTDLNTDRAFDSLTTRFNSWNDVADAPTECVVDAIRIGGLANQKAPRIQSVLHTIRAERPDYDLRFLATIDPDEAAEWLTRFPGVGPKTAACVLLFSLHQPVMPVDTHVHRVSLRLGLVPEGTSAVRAQPMLERIIAPEDRYDAHLLFIHHGRVTCIARRPRCEQCTLADICPSASLFLDN